MEKQKRWQFYLILAVLLLTLYNILPTVFYYTKPLKSPIGEKKAESIAQEIMVRVNSLEKESEDWLYSFAKLLKIKINKIGLYKNNPGLIEINFANKQGADLFKRYLPRAGSSIAFVPAQLSLALSQATLLPTTVLVERQIDVKIDPTETKQFFQYFSKLDENNHFSAPYKEFVFDRATNLALSLGVNNQKARLVNSLTYNSKEAPADKVISLAAEIVDVEKTFHDTSSFLKRYFSHFNYLTSVKLDPLSNRLTYLFQTVKQKLVIQKKELENKQKRLVTESLSLEPGEESQLFLVSEQISYLDKAEQVLKNYANDFNTAQKPLLEKAIQEDLLTHYDPSKGPQLLSLNQTDPFIEAIVIDWSNDVISLKLYQDIEGLRHQESNSEVGSFLKEKVNQYLINSIAQLAVAADENLKPYQDSFAIQLNELANPHSFLKLDLRFLAYKQMQAIKTQLSEGFSPKNQDLKADLYPVRSYEQFLKESPENQALGFMVYAPIQLEGYPVEGFKKSSLYIIAKGLDTILQKYQDHVKSAESKELTQDIEQLKLLLKNMNFIGYPGSSYGIDSRFASDYIFEYTDFYSHLIKATREDFEIHGSKQYAILPFTDLEQRIITTNKIEDRQQEDLLKWAESYHAAQIDPDPLSHYQIPAPITNPYWNNFKISLAKYFRGDDRKILKWGLDLSGGKTVRIGLIDHNNQSVTDPNDIKQAVNELYTRINKMGVSERTIRIENQNIVLEFPGAQGLSASDLVKASAMYFYLVNEKFSPTTPRLGEIVNQFLQNVWNEAVVTNRKDLDSIKAIAWQHLGGATLNQGQPRPINESARLLYENGLRLANPKENLTSNQFDDSLSTIALLRGEDFTDWHGQTHPLLITFNNYALEGASLTNIQIGYDPSEGNNLSFSIKRNYDNKNNQTGSPRDDFYAWTSQFSEDKITGTSKEEYTQGRGWRMAVVLNSSIISMPSLRAALKDSATISGHFSQREIAQLAADLKAGSLSFTPRILSEQNVSAELGSEERFKGIIASSIALILVVIAMISYYRFAGVIASCAVLLNIFIMWGVLQNLDAALTLPAIAGIVLTIGMAVDANVLVFERVREEFALSGRIASAIQTGYKKAFSAIIDSNITTIIAALILIQFDSGPIKGFAVTLIVGIISSMFTALFLTRYYFAGWVQNPAHKELHMAQFFGKTNFDFLKASRAVIIGSGLTMLIGCYFLATQHRTILGMDFTGGYAVTLEAEPMTLKDKQSYRQAAIDALLAHGASARDVQIRELTKPNQLRIQLGIGLEEKGQPFYQMPEQLNISKIAYSYQENPRIVWLVNALQAEGLTFSSNQLTRLESDWTIMSGQFSDTMRNNALIALALALFSILIYITFRFEFKYAIAAVIGLTHDVIITLGILAIFHALGFVVQIDLQVIGAIMTIIGYSLNDTIIVFDRIREDIRILRKLSYAQIINHALNVTLSRTVMTSGTTSLVLLALVFLGGHSIFAFSLVMLIGVIVGTLSSLFIATPVLLFIHNREETTSLHNQLATKKN